METLTLDKELLKLAYARGYFPMPHSKTGEMLWLSPDPRAILPLENFHVSRSLQRLLKRGEFTCTVNQAFMGVMNGCADRAETWITDEFKQVYYELHLEGAAHSLEIWLNGALVGGVYGVAIGGAFFAESMFSKVDNASKVALYYLVQRLLAQDFILLEVQFLTEHLKSLGCIEISGGKYLTILRVATRLRRQFA